MERDLSHHQDEGVVYRVGSRSRGWTLERFLQERIPRLDLDQIREAIRVRVKLSWAKTFEPETLVEVGGDVHVGFPPLEELPLDLEVATLFEDEVLLAVDKPSGLLVHPTSYRRQNTLTRILERRLGYGLYMVHRLDRDTSGVFLLTKTKDAAQRLTKDFELRRVEKEYLAWTRGEISSDSGRMDSPLAKVRFTPEGMKREIASSEAEGEEALTEFSIETRTGGCTLVRLFPRTGRTHQLRVHLASIGHPILGDKLYGSKDEASRLLLHAAKLTFEHPVTGRRVTVASPIPAGFGPDRRSHG